MQAIYSNYTASVSELKKSPKTLIEKMGDNETIAILNRNTPTAYIVPSKLYEKMLEMLDDYALGKEVKKVKMGKDKNIRIKLDEL